jgi:hypothetical protein
MKLKLSQCLEYVEEVGHKMSERTYYRKKKQVEDMKLERMKFIAKVAYEEQHLERLDKMELIENQMWTNYWHEKDPTKKVKILGEIAHIQPYISGYYEATKMLLEERESKINAEREFHRPLKPPPGMNQVDNEGDIYWAEPNEEFRDKEPVV